MPLYYSQSYRKSRVFTKKQGKKAPKKQQLSVILIVHYHNKTKTAPICCGKRQKHFIICRFFFFFVNSKNSLTSDMYCGILFRRDERSLFFVLQTFSHTVTDKSQIQRGGRHAYQNHTCLHRVQEQKLRYKEG